MERDGLIAVCEIRRPPLNFFDDVLIGGIADTFARLDADPDCRAIVLCAQGKVFCAGANFGDGVSLNADGNTHDGLDDEALARLYASAARIFEAATPIVAAVQGPAIGGGLGLALAADFRVASPEARFAANFTALGIHPGFGLTVTLPRVVGHQQAALMFATARRIKGDDAVAIGLADQLAPLSEVRAAACVLAREIAANAPLAVQSTRQTLRLGLADAVRAATARELAEQVWLRRTEDFREGVAAAYARRSARFAGR